MDIMMAWIRKKNKEMIHITDLSLLKITKVKNWAINFDYDGKHYLLHGDSEPGEGSWNSLYERELDENGCYKLELLITVDGEEWVENYYINRQKGKTIVYKNIDKEYFALKLTKRGLATGIMEQKAEEDAELVEKLRAEIKLLESKAAELRREMYKLEQKGELNERNIIQS